MPTLLSVSIGILTFTILLLSLLDTSDTNHLSVPSYIFLGMMVGLCLLESIQRRKRITIDKTTGNLFKKKLFTNKLICNMNDI